MSFEYQVILFAVDTPTAKLGPIDENLPHSMLPICNRPLISYQLELLENAGFHSVLIVMHEYAQSKIRPYVQEIYKGKIEVEFFVLKDQIGSCEILFRIRDKIRTPNFIVMNGNLIADEIFIKKMADKHRSNDASLTVLLNPPPPAPSQPTKSSDTVDTSFVDYIALDESNDRILFMERATEIEDEIPISKSLLTHFPNLIFNNNLQDSQFYIFSRWVIDLIAEDQKNKTQFISIKNHLIPYLLSCQVPGHSHNLPSTAFNYSHDLGLSMSSSASPFNPSYHINQSTRGTIKCMAYLMRDGYCASINNLQSYKTVNNDIARGASNSFKPHEPKGKNNYIDPTAQVAPTSVGADCVIGMATVLGAKSSVKKSIIGKHCKFGQSVRIENAIIMDYVTVEDGCSINGSIIGNNVYIKTKIAVKDSQVASGFTVNKELKSKAVGNELE